ncbi:MAG: family 20 glycosylhydrolase [Bacteroidota bacterium]
MKKTAFQVVILILFTLYSCKDKVEFANVKLLPHPNYLEIKQGAFIIDPKTVISINSSDIVGTVEPLKSYLKEKFAIELEVQVDKNNQNNSINLIVNTDLELPENGYEIDISSRNIKISSKDGAGIFYGINTLVQLLSNANSKPTLPNIYIKDFPRFGWRGMHLDVSRHFMPVPFVKKYIDIMAMYKLNIFHWHLVDGIGWRIEIKSHPELTDIGAWRVVKKNKKPWEDIEAWKEGDERPKYGGFYTQEEVKEIIKYAEERFITIVPEIELPGHSEIVFDCFEDLVCKDNDGKSLDNIGVYCASNPNSYKLLEDVLTEIIELFPSEYIHIGGDEVNKKNWENCTRCQNFMQEKKYNSHELQSHFVNHFDKFIRSKNRKLMGWDEITEGNLSPTASITFWHGIEELNDKLKKNHPTVIGSGTSYYFDHYQSVSEHEPQAWGGFSPLPQVYNLEPVSPTIDQNLQKLILGIQGQVWTEHMPTPSHVEYMLLPRMLALAESSWTLPKYKDWDRFSNAVLNEFKRFEELDINYSKSSLRPIIYTKLDTVSRKINVTISSDIPTEIIYTLDGSTPTINTGIKYTNPFSIDTSLTISAVAIHEGKIITEPERKDLYVHKALGRKVTLKNKPHPNYTAKGEASIVDMEYGGRTWGNGKWIGVFDQDLDIEINLEKEVEVSKVILSCINDNAAWIYFPEDIEVLISQDGKSFSPVHKWERNLNEQPTANSSNMRRQFSLEFDKVSCKYLKVKAKHLELENQSVYIFVDEIIVL